MATYESDFAATAVTKLGFNRIYTIYEAATALALNDTIKGPKVARDLMVLDGGISVDDLDTGALMTLTLRVTDGTTPKNLFVASTVGQAGGTARADTTPADAMGYKIPNHNYWLELLVAAAPAGGGTGTIFMWVDVHSQLQHGD